jgi:hypothetical protein
MSFVRGVGRFVYDFVIGDDWKIATAVVIALLAGLVLLVVGVAPAVTALATATLVAAAFTAAMVIDVRRR